MPSASHSHPRSPDGFTLIELLCVLAIITVISVLSVYSVERITLSTNLTASASLVIDALNLARQRALSSNCPVEVRFYQVPASTGNATFAFRAMGLYEITGNGPQLINKIIYLNGNVVLSNSQTFGTLLYYTSSLSAPLIPGSSGPSYNYQYFQYRSDGSTSLNTQPTASDTWHVMLYNSNQPPAGAIPPSNYISIQIDPTSGRTEIFQP